MDRSPEDLDFARYCRTGDPEALGAVFDRTAGKLLLVAVHLCRHEAQAEDLVQATFVQAMRARERFDPARRALPWLLGILAREASGARRLAARDARVPARDEVDPHDPAQALLSEELRAELAQALDSLPETYRVVLDLRYVHGLRCVQIARTLGRSPETVRTQVRRGLEHLRRIVPRSLAVPVALVAVRGRGLAAVRAAVLEQARGMSAVSVAATAGGVGLWWAAALVLAVGIAGTAWLGTSGLAGDVPEPPVAALRAAPGSMPGTVSGDLRTVGTEPNAAAHEGTTTVAPPSAPKAPTTPRLLGRCLTEESREPLGGCAIRLTLRDGSALDAESDGTGRFTLDLSPWRAGQAGALRITAAGRFPLYTALSGFDPAVHGDLGDVLVPRGVQVSGTVVDDEGATLSGVDLTCLREAQHDDGPPVGRWRGGWLVAKATTDERGRYTLGMPLVAGAWRISVGEEFELVQPKTLQVRADPTQEEGIVLRRLDPKLAISGVVVDDQGPVPDRYVHAVDPGSRLRTLGEARTNDRGEFRIFQRGTPPEVVVLLAEDNVPLRAPLPEARWGTQGLRIQVRRRPPPAAPEATAVVQLEVVDTKGRPISDYAVRCCADPRACARFSATAGALRLAGPHPEGKLLVEASVRWRNVLFVEPADPRLRAAGPVFFDAAQTSVRVVVRERAVFRVRVVRKDGTPIAGARVELLRPWHKEVVAVETGKVALRDPFVRLQIQPWAVCVDEADTGPDGVAALAAPAGEPGLVLRLPGPRHRPLVLASVTATDDTLVATVDSGGTLVGTLRGWPQLRGYDMRARILLGGPRPENVDPDWCRPTLILWLPNATGQFFYFPHLFPRHSVAEDGTFRMEGLLPGTWGVYLFCQLGQMPAPRPLQPALATVTVAEGEVSHLDLDGSALLPGRIHGRMLVDGEPLVRTAWYLVRQVPGNHDLGPLPDVTPTDGAGAFAVAPVVPGSYRIMIQWPDPKSGQRLQLTTAETIEVGPGEDVERTVRFDSRQAVDPLAPLRR